MTGVLIKLEQVAHFEFVGGVSFHLASIASDHIE